MRIVEHGRLWPEPFIAIDVNHENERGLLGIAIDPDYARNRFVYVYYTHPEPISHRLVRYRDAGNRGVEPRTLLAVRKPTGATNHNGGNIHFGPDGMLYVTIGENADPALAQRRDSALGKILRLNPRDGSVPPDNPFYDDGDPASGNDDRIWALGLRNSFDFTFHPGTGAMFATENGPACDDEINLLRPGGNYGWRPGIRCGDPHPGFTAPLLNLETTIAVTGIEFYQGAALPGLRGTLFVCAWNTFALLRVRGTDASYRALTGYETWDVSCQTDVLSGPDGGLYLADRSTIRRIVPATPPPPDYAVPNGWFYTQAGGGYGRGFAVVDGAEGAFWTGFQALGCVPALGYPASQMFRLDGFVYQATQRSLLQWDPIARRVNLANVFDMLAAAGHDPWLEAYRLMPPSQDWSSDAGRPFGEVVARHLAILATPTRRCSDATRTWLTGSHAMDCRWAWRLGTV
ncbi:MAG: PQQ-dependent sugar dehydrogenase [Actinobacteria bacterium]|nr:PQQ-dependent sugar dehydrogenase [Actinomycetota bacterium]